MPSRSKTRAKTQSGRFELPGLQHCYIGGIPKDRKQFNRLLVGVSAYRKLPNLIIPWRHTYSERRTQDRALYSWHRLFKELYFVSLLLCGSDRIYFIKDFLQRLGNHNLQGFNFLGTLQEGFLSGKFTLLYMDSMDS